MSNRLRNGCNTNTKATLHCDIQFKSCATGYLQHRHQLLLQRKIHLCLSSEIKEVPERQKNRLFLDYKPLLDLDKDNGDSWCWYYLSEKKNNNPHIDESLAFFAFKFNVTGNSGMTNFLPKLTTAHIKQIYTYIIILHHLQASP